VSLVGFRVLCFVGARGEILIIHGTLSLSEFNVFIKVNRGSGSRPSTMLVDYALCNDGAEMEDVRL
jgi:hypothetical protein